MKRGPFTTAFSPGRRLLLLGVAGAAAAALGGWWWFVRPDRRPPAESGAVRVLWAFEPPERGAIISSPLVAGDRVFVAAIRDAGPWTRGAVYCLDDATGRPLWKFDDDGEMLHTYGTPCLADGRLFLGEGMHGNHVCKFYCLDAARGAKLWHFVAGDHLESSPCVAAGAVFFGAGDDGVYCLDAVTGTERWHFHEPVHVDSSPAVKDERVFAGAGISRAHKKPEAFCLDRDNGSVVWRQPTDLPVWGSPVVDGEQVFFGLGNGRLLESVAPPEVPAGTLLCLAADTGRECWRFPVGDGVLTQPTLGPVRVFFGARDGFCYCLDRTNGRLCWKQPVGSPVVTRLALLNDRLYVVPLAGKVCRLDAANGAIDWTFDLAATTQTRPQMLSSPTAVAEPDGNVRVYFGAELRNPVTSAAVLYCLLEERRDGPKRRDR
jgi:outer membrane protein assembly factor BamB